MRDVYTSHAAGLRDALRHAATRGGQSSLPVLHQGVPSAATLTGDDATAQAARIRRQLDRLAALARAARARLRAAYAQMLVWLASCAGTYPAPEWEAATRVVLVHVAPPMSGCTAR